MSSVAIVSQRKQDQHAIARFHLEHVSQSVVLATNGDVCKETCKIDAPDTCKLECHSGAPFAEMWETLPAEVA